MRIIECEQGSPEWIAARVGRLGASRLSDALARTKSGWGATRANVAAALVSERLTGMPSDSYTNAAMAWGQEQEQNARLRYEFERDASVIQIGLALHPTMDMTHASPDGLVGSAGLLEIKCPNTATHIATLLGAEIDGKYIKQMQWQMLCCERSWCDFVSFDPRMSTEMQIHIRRVHRDDKMLAVLQREVSEFLDEVATTVEKLRALYPAIQEAAE